MIDETQFLPLQLRNKKIFEENQRFLLVFINSFYGKSLLGIQDKRPIVQVWANGYSFLNEDETCEAHLFAYEKCAKYLASVIEKKELAKEYYPGIKENLKTALHFADIRRSEKLPQIFLNATRDVYAGAATGFCESGGDPSWNTVRNSATSTFTFGTGDISAGVNYTDRYYMYRGFIPIDTSVISNVSIVSAILKLYCNTKHDDDNDGNDFIRVVLTTQTTPTAIVTGDYANCGTLNNPTALTNDFDITSLTASAYNNFTLNAAGLVLISKTGYTKLGIREGHDAVNDPMNPSGNTVTDAGFAGSQTAGTSQDPYISIVYSDFQGGMI